MTKECKWRKVQDKDVEDILWDDMEPLLIEEYPWDKDGYKPRCEVRFFYTESKLYLHFRSFERKVRAIHRNMNDPVYEDSCVEFFFSPNPEEDSRYFNFEINALGALLLGLGKDRDSRRLVKDISQEIFNIKSSIPKDVVHDYRKEFWDLEFSIPYTFIEKHFGKQSFAKGKRIKGNFQKCGDKTKYPHYGSWSRIEAQEPDFHRPEFFGYILFN